MSETLPYKTVNSEIILCPYCKGQGYVIHSELDDYHHGTYSQVKDLCTNCAGTGLVKKTTIKYQDQVTFEPYDAKKVSQEISDSKK